MPLDVAWIAGSTWAWPPVLGKVRRDILPVEHLVVCIHTETGQRTLYANPLFTRRVCQFDRTEIDGLLGTLCGLIRKPEHPCRFRWREGSITLWDNRAPVHYVMANCLPRTCIIERILITREPPVAALPRPGARTGAR